MDKLLYMSKTLFEDQSQHLFVQPLFCRAKHDKEAVGCSMLGSSVVDLLMYSDILMEVSYFGIYEGCFF